MEIHMTFSDWEWQASGVKEAGSSLCSAEQTSLGILCLVNGTAFPEKRGQIRVCLKGGGLNNEGTAKHATWGASEGKDALTSDSSSAIYKRGNLPTEGLLTRLHSPKSMVRKELGRSSGVRNQSCRGHSWQSVETVLLREAFANFWERSLNWRVVGFNVLQGHSTNKTATSLQVPIVSPQNKAYVLLLSPGPRKWLHF